MAKGRERTAKFYFKNENEVMRELGLKPAVGSGSGWIDKEDGENDHVICQLKSTDKTSYKVTQLDLEKLEYHASVSNKVPMFVIQFLNKDTRYALVAIEDIPKISEYINTGEIEVAPGGIDINTEGIADMVPKKKKAKVSSSPKAREKYLKAMNESWENRKFNK